jgi:hypothetical protein
MATNARLRWFRLYDEARTDPKLASLTDAQFRVWFNLLCLSNEQPERGVIAGYTPRLLAIEVSHGDVNLLSETVNALSELRMIETSEDTDDVYFIHWQERQYDKPSDRPEATRERKARSRESVSRAVTPSHAQSRDGHAPSRREREREGEGEGEGEGIHTPKVVMTSKSGNRVVKGASAPKPTPAPRSPDPIWDALCDALSLRHADFTPSQRADCGRTVQELKAAAATPDEIHVRIARMLQSNQLRFVTFRYIREHWSEYAVDRHEGQHDHTAGQRRAPQPQRRPHDPYQGDAPHVVHFTEEEARRLNASRLRPLPPDHEPQAS